MMPEPVPLRGRVGLVVGPALFLLLVVLPPPEGLSLAGWRTAARAIDPAQMARVGLVLNVAFVVLITVHAFTLAHWVL